MAAERPIQSNDHYDDQRERARDCGGHRYMHAEAFESKEIGVGGGNRRAEKDDVPDYPGNMPLNGREPGAARVVELVP